MRRDKAIGVSLFQLVYFLTYVFGHVEQRQQQLLCSPSLDNNGTLTGEVSCQNFGELVEDEQLFYYFQVEEQDDYDVMIILSVRFGDVDLQDLHALKDLANHNYITASKLSVKKWYSQVEIF
eukprot:TRINITY_DN1698_c0_g1_i1.p9 TRINITY_DN1698_c0_g1~~TRINITY_DN1698_c0_g1_i1.p9  ORF type:complete len:122 (-),score=8.90 TRINITY_DN1698_c0_g1_i1:1931-2296(-)